MKLIEGPVGLRLESLSLVEHPGGSDGGDFPCYEYFEITKDGGVQYTYDLPSSPTDTFCDEDPEDYNCCSTKEEAIDRLESEKKSLEETLKHVENALTALKNGATYTTFCESVDNDENEDEYEDEYE